MTTIGTFQIDKDGDWVGRVQTSAAKRTIRITAVGRANKLQPDYQVMKGNVMVGVAWWMATKADAEYLEVKFSDKLWGQSKVGVLKICGCGCGAELVM